MAAAQWVRMEDEAVRKGVIGVLPGMAKPQPVTWVGLETQTPGSAGPTTVKARQGVNHGAGQPALGDLDGHEAPPARDGVGRGADRPPGA
ncbi:hypothetical protein NITHO_1090002 [Nitrolancea hollandica Lb]|uniref:Uncharacterized protein n=1 Tax=Nitrolancea hollandica Lb TaxID=1129897 RepID=I4ECK4_9BACT|nr:hypothetical protein NITHO_1090002 [Nitrolancea hollandica Lb]